MAKILRMDSFTLSKTGKIQKKKRDKNTNFEKCELL